MINILPLLGPKDDIQKWNRKILDSADLEIPFDKMG
jgi:hypothetical protein